MVTHRLGRLRFLSFFVFGLVGLLIVRLFFLQIIKHSYYLDRADRQYQLPSAQLPDRGTIFFRQKDGTAVSAATMRTGFILAINPTQIKNLDQVYQALNNLLPLDDASFRASASKLTDPYEELATRLDQATADKIANLKLPGVGVYKTHWRYYPAGREASHLLGLVNYKNVGTYGLEKYYDALLQRQTNENFISFLSSVVSDVKSSVIDKNNAKTEADLTTSIEPVVQDTLEKTLAQVKATWQSEQVGGIVLDPETGEVLAMAALPDFNPGGKQDSLANLSNPLVERVYELGSIMKALTMAAGLDSGAVTAKTTYNDTGTITLNNQQISNYDGRARGVISMQEVLNQSLNLGAVFVMQQLGRDRFRDYFSHYGLAEQTGIDLPNEALGLNNWHSQRDVDYATEAFGQGIAVTPIEMARALAALGNGGKLIRPQVVINFDYYNSKLSKTVKPEIIRQVLKPETSKEITRMLVQVVDTALKGGIYKMDKYSIAAKTGTAQQVRPGASGYDPDYFLHSFFGYFPASNPRFLILLYQLHPIGAPYASDTLTEPFMSLTKFLLNYYNVPPDR